jgi:hypothetical protein
MILTHSLIMSFAFSALLASPLYGQTITPAEEQAIQTALSRGQLLYAYDQATWHGTDAMLADAKARGLTDTLPTRIAGWIVRGTANDPLVIYFDKDGSDPHAVFTAQVTDGGRRVRSSHFFVAGEDATIDADTQSLIRARQLALASFDKAGLPHCSKGHFNTVVLPPDRPGGSVLVYILSPQDEIDKIPFGGNYRVEVSGGEITGPIHAFTKSCVVLETSSTQDEKTTALFVTQILDPLPTEISVFTMFAANFPLYVMAPPDKRLWKIETVNGQARIRVVSNVP